MKIVFTPIITHSSGNDLGAALLESDAPLEALEQSTPPGSEGRGRRGPGRPRLRTTAPRGPSRRPRRPREPLLVPLAPPP